ncbi:AbrB/MazE/SpoVT family DNA-binding domain-containing protein [Metabacillus rhizolycopersici]|uniref:AbrB/MazE/SpoVT family DNA-binding domain-containing protein n=1 Tax=Metabacillus rhizolycopersici TaxID=2875709 RepID=A0ABS7V0C8_9BACI|nr:AbrB/MazE/SpoVT family DNA-binding domain-containing protein [Metabacillus rhizolycopersici]MBZ5753708.1 AbrB/MazE/SpoVT family DNA-binding domain-containing protein [Metabacillus rhizolycopersici]
MVIRTPEKGVDIVKKEKITLRKRGQFTLPKAFMEELNLHEGDSLEIRLDENGRLTLVPMIHVPADQAWFWTDKWQREEEEAETNIKKGEVYTFKNIDEAFNWLDSDIED